MKTPRNNIHLPAVYSKPRTNSEHIAHQFSNNMRPDPNSQNVHEYYEVDRAKNVIGQSETADL